MTEAAGDRPQDVGRSHRRAPGIAPETAELLERYRDAMRAELADTLTEIRPGTGQLTIAGDVERPKLDVRIQLWNLAIKLGRELAGGPTGDAGIDGPPAAMAPAVIPRRRPAPRLKARERRSLGG